MDPSILRVPLWTSGGLKLCGDLCEQPKGRAGVGHQLFGQDNKEKARPGQRGGSRGNALSSDPSLINPLKMPSGDMSVKDVTEVGEECSLLSGPRTQRPVCAHVGTPDPGWISCFCFLLHHHNTTTQLQCALLPPPQESWAVGLVPTGCPLSTASNPSLPAHLAPGESRVSIVCFSLPSFTALSRLPFLSPAPAHV